MAAARKRNPYANALGAAARAVSKARASKLHAPLFDAFVIFAAAGDVKRASTILDWMYGTRTPPPNEVASALSTAAIDGFCHAANLGDRSAGLPMHEVAERRPTRGGSLRARVAEGEVTVRDRLTRDAYGGGKRPVGDAWQERKPPDPWRRIDQWRQIQALAATGHEDEALTRLAELLDELEHDDRGPGYGNELVLAIDLALRHEQVARVPAWLERRGHRFARQPFLIEMALCLPAIASQIARGALRGTVGLSDAELASALTAIDAALHVSAKTPPKPVGRVQRRRAGAEYSQVHLEPETLDGSEREQAHFQRPGDSERGMSLFPTRVAIGTPTDTDYVDAEITIAAVPAPPLPGVVQAVAFPIDVRGPLVLASVAGTDAEPFVVPPGSYDVSARFVPKKAPRASRAASLRVFTLRLSFHPPGTLAAPRTIKMER